LLVAVLHQYFHLEFRLFERRLALAGERDAAFEMLEAASKLRSPFSSVATIFSSSLRADSKSGISDLELLATRASYVRGKVHAARGRVNALAGVVDSAGLED